MTALVKIDQLIEDLRADPDNRVVLTKLLDLLDEDRVRYYEVGEYYSVPRKIGKKIEHHVTKLLKFSGPCSRDCLNKLVCPGVMIFEDGTEICPYPPFSKEGRRVRREDMTHDVAVTRAVLKILKRGHKRGTVELLDGTTLELRVKKPSNAADA